MPELVQVSKEDATGASAAETANTAVVKPPSEKEQLLALLRHNFLLIERSVSHIEQRFTARVLRTLPYVRRKVGAYPEVLALAVQEGILANGQDDSSIQKHLLSFLPAPYKPEPPSASNAGSTTTAASDAMDIDSAEPKAEADKDAKTTSAAAAQASKPAQRQPEAQPELVAYLRLLTLVLLIDNKKLDAASDEAVASISTITAQNRRTLDHLAAKTIFYLGRAQELKAEQAQAKGTRVEGGLTSIRSQLLGLQRTASLRHDTETEATIINLLLRSYIVEANLYDQADKLVARAPFPRSSASNPQVARYDYYVGRIRAVQLDYTQAHVHLQQAIRRAPQASLPQESGSAGSEAGANGIAATTAVGGKKEASGKKGSTTVGQSQPAAGFLQTAYKFLVVVELLMGEIPERSIFRTPVLRKALAPYMEIVQAVRVGDLQRFQSTLQQHTTLFQTDKTLSLIVRLRHNVIKTGIRMISLSYSRISLADITHKLHLESEEDAEYIVAKAIRDNVVDSRDTRVDHEKAEMVNRETKDLYETDEPMQQFQQRIQFCLQLHNESVKAMRYPLNGHKKELDSVAEAHERERELAAEIADGEMDDSDDDWA
ncbi:putative 26S proteasome non-ATPase regulatory subunit p58 [Mycosarcoma maydis]|uniref:26S proteasome non-ATPase regulatory subunit p58 n=1 Tax=Mycosarcoma maydis TaxID=5270 RepID=A0A0D1E262_MYCMD|nr:putative 26S proteasome non-ATPase regulatory subunit p58 [Ustilago maydis 521]KIS68680.1 putative 26S proteasome non-ATPase regulatory subunit p58 [Ustilago maydis 521]|eukprot:XP_011389672.1 putative 26S proteasome non-ATPase regulatory subunit p58 [Ustilago maydis 521]